MRSIYFWHPPTPLEIARKELAEAWQPMFDAERTLESAIHQRDELAERIKRLKAAVESHTPKELK